MHLKTIFATGYIASNSNQTNHLLRHIWTIFVVYLRYFLSYSIQVVYVSSPQLFLNRTNG